MEDEYDDVMDEISRLIPPEVSAIFYFPDGSFRGSVARMDDDDEDVSADSSVVDAMVAMLINHPAMDDLRQQVIDRALSENKKEKSWAPPLNGPATAL